MATSVQLRACGGIGPYTWSSTGNIALSDTQGTQITVIPTGTGSTAADSITIGGLHLAAYLKQHIAYAYQNAVGSCGGGRTEMQWSVSTTGTDAFMEGFNCAQQSLGSSYALPRSTNCFVGSSTNPWNWVGTTMTVSGGDCDQVFGPIVNSNINFSFSSTSPCCLAEPVITLNLVFNSAPAAANSTTVESTINIPVGTGVVLSGLLDVRTQCMFDTGCANCDPTGSTVTVTDDAGVSVTYTF